MGLTWYYPRSALALPFNLGLFGRLILLGITSGLAAYLLVLLMDGLHRAMHHLRQDRHWWPPVFPLLAALALVVLMGFVGRSYGGLSLPLLTQALSGQPVPALAWGWKLLFVGITLGFGMSGGIITPLFVIGATLGSILAIPLHLPLAIGAELGMIAVTAAGANAPIAAIIMGMEIFGSRLAPDFLMVAVPAFIMIGNHSVYPSQRVRLQKSPWVPIPIGQSLEDAKDVPLPFPWTRRRPELEPRNGRDIS